ncbi:MAG: YeiH family protein [Bacteroidales bacterium]|nr:YeiH family protein [Bacteroidales bacterium]
MMKISENRAATWHGVLLIVLFSFSAFYIAQWQWVRDLSLSPLIVGIVLGMLYANSLRNHLPDTWVPGIKFCTKQVLRWGIIFYGFRITFQELCDIGASAILIDVIIIAGTMAVGILAGKLLRMDRDTSLMVSTGSAVCGAAAVLGAEPVVKCAPYKTAIAVSTVVIFGTISMFLYPVLYRTGVFDMTPTQMAVFTGSTLHEVAHVTGAGNAMDPGNVIGLESAAMITKMIRVMMLAPLLLIMAFCLPSGAHQEGVAKSAGKGKKKITIPWFAFGFLLVIGINSLLQEMPSIPAEGLDVFHDAINTLDVFMLTMAMTALGAETSFDKFKQAGAKPFLLAGIIYVWLVLGGYFITKAMVA